MKDINLSLYDDIVDHLSDARNYEETGKIGIGRIVRRHQKRIRDQFVKNPTTNFKPEIQRFGVELNSYLTNNIGEYGDAALSFYSNEFEKYAGKFYQVQKPKAGSAFPKTIGPSFSKLGLKQSVDNISSYHLARVNAIVKRGLKDGTSKKEMLDQILTSTRMPETQAKSLLRTSLTNTQSNALTQVVDANKTLVKHLRFTAVLDNRTSAVCSANDGKTFPSDKIEFKPPLHFNCRSSLVPILYSKDELLKSDDTRIKKTNLEKVKDLTGQVPTIETYSNWLRRQPMEVQRKHVGTEEKVSLFQQGKLQLNNFITGVGNAIDITVLRKLDNAKTFFFRTRQQAIDLAERDGFQVQVQRPYQLLRNTEAQKQLKALYIADAESLNQNLSLVDYRGTSIPGKRVSRVRSNNEFDERNNSFDPITGEQRSTLFYDPDFTVFQERLDFVRNSKTLRQDQKVFIQEFVEGLEDQVSVNQQAAITENLRIIIERANVDGTPWENFNNVVRSEMQFSVVNTSRILDRRSRARSEQFIDFGVAGEPAKVQILGEYKTFNSITDNVLETRRFAKSWSSKFATPISRKVLFSGRSPLFTYFEGPIGRDKFKFKNALEKFVREKIPGGKLWLDRNKPTEPLLQKFIRESRESLRKIIDLEFLYRSNKTSYFEELIQENIGGKQAIRVLNKATELIASGQSTDYDTLAINIGKMIRQEWKLTEKHDFPFFKPTLKDYHADGSQVLNGFRDSGYIRVISRGKTRRSVIDLDTGRASGPYRDTVSREVQILNKDMIALQKANREFLISTRIGIVNDRDRLFVRPGEKSYFDARGNNTGIPIITRRANANYDKILIDRDFANMLNHTMSVKYEVDQEFGAFMEDVVRFRDPRGNVKKYDDLNDFRKLILTRGDQGYGLMQTVKFHRENNQPFTVLANIDGRGRVYYQGYLSPTGGVTARPFLNSAREYAMTQNGLREIMIQLGVLVADTTEGLSNAGRMRAFLANEKKFRELGELLTATTQRDRRIREFLEHPLIRATDAEEIPQLTRLALEYYRIHKHTNGNLADNRLLSTYKTKLMVDNDASASGAQIIALSTRDRQLALNSNVVPTAQKNRLYDLVAMDTVADPDFQKISALRDAGISWEDLQKAAKSANMVQLYGAGARTISLSVESKLADVLEKKGFQVVTREELRDFNQLVDRKIKDSELIGAENVIFELKQLKREINESLEGQSSLGAEIMRQARDIHPDAEVFVDKLTNSRLVGPRVFSQVATIMSKYLAQRAPVTENFIVFWKEVGETFVKETSKVDIPWVTFDDKRLYQRYRPKIQTSIEFYDKQAKRFVRNIYEDRAEDSRLLGKSSIASARIGLGVNGNHMTDASVVRQYHLWGRKNNIDTATIHDAFMTNVTLAQESKDALREIYGNAAESDIIRKTLRAMREEGLSRASYEKFLKKAKDMGLLDPDDPLTKKEILQEIKEGFDFYGIGL